MKDKIKDLHYYIKTTICL